MMGEHVGPQVSGVSGLAWRTDNLFGGGGIRQLEWAGGNTAFFEIFLRGGGTAWREGKGREGAGGGGYEYT